MNELALVTLSITGNRSKLGIDKMFYGLKFTMTDCLYY